MTASSVGCRGYTPYTMHISAVLSSTCAVKIEETPKMGAVPAGEGGWESDVPGPSRASDFSQTTQLVMRHAKLERPGTRQRLLELQGSGVLAPAGCRQSGHLPAT